MKIIKYIFLLILLALVGISVYIATQNGDYTIKRSTFIKVTKEIVFNYVNDYRNWDQWIDLEVNSSDITFDFPENTIGQGGAFSWKNGNQDGKIETLYVKANDSISQRISVDGTVTQSSLTIKDSIGGTKLNWTIIGTADFKTKITATFNGGIEQLIAKMYQNSLNNFTAMLTKEIKTFSVEVIGEVKIDSVFYVKQTVTVPQRDMNSKISFLLQKMDKFFRNGNLQMNGKPFVIYESTNPANGTITFTVCGPLKEEIFVSAPSDVEIAKRKPFTALKTILKGDYSHRNEAIKKAMSYIAEKKLNRNTTLKNMDVYARNVSDSKSPSQWITEVLIPIEPTVILVPTAVIAPTLNIEDAIVE